MEDRIQEHDRGGYCSVAPRYRVEYVITDASAGELPRARTFLEQVHESDGIRIFRAPDCGAGSAGD
jgi:hypothetical protein